MPGAGSIIPGNHFHCPLITKEKNLGPIRDRRGHRPAKQAIFLHFTLELQTSAHFLLLSQDPFAPFHCIFLSFFCSFNLHSKFNSLASFSSLLYDSSVNDAQNASSRMADNYLLLLAVNGSGKLIMWGLHTPEGKKPSSDGRFYIPQL